MKIAGHIEEERVGGNIAIGAGQARARSGKALASGTESVIELDDKPVVTTEEGCLTRAADDNVVDELNLLVQKVYGRPVGGIVVRDSVIDKQGRPFAFTVDSAALLGAVASN